MIDNTHLDLLNARKRKKPWISWVIGQLLVSSIIVNLNHGLLINGVKAYSRFPSINSHYVNTLNQFSLPDHTSQYPNQLKITKIYYDNSERLVIGTNTCNLLLVSSIRIDDDRIAPEVGASTTSFEPSAESRIFLSVTSIKHVMNLMESGN